MKKPPLQLPRTYLAGPMTGYEEHNFPAFQRFAAHLRQNGHLVVNPEELESKESGPRKSWEYYQKRDQRELLECDHIAVMPGWSRSRGASLEVYVGWRLGFKIISAETLNPVDVSQYNFSEIENENNAGAFVRAFTPPKMERCPEALAFDAAVKRFAAPCATDMGPDYRPNKETILDEAQRIVGGDRAKAYGHPKTDFDRTALIWEAILGIKLKAYQVALCMIGVKMSRECNARKRDNAVDIAGYAQTLSMVNEKEGAY